MCTYIDVVCMKTELLDVFSTGTGPHTSSIVPPAEVDSSVIGIRAATFTWSSDHDGTVTPGSNRRNFSLRIDNEVTFKRGSINLIVGPTGSGKTSILMALLGWHSFW